MFVNLFQCMIPSMEISDKDYQEYILLKKQGNRNEIQESINSVIRLEDDIDEPIKTCVMAFALLKCHPVWSCCGFDYAQQPLHKFHQYGRCYFVLQNSVEALSIANALIKSNTPYFHVWELYLKPDRAVDFHADFKNVIKQWDDSQSIHYSEQVALYIGYLEKFLLSLHYAMVDVPVTLKDTNQSLRDASPYWQYPPKEPWTFTKEDLMRRVNGKI